MTIETISISIDIQILIVIDSSSCHCYRGRFNRGRWDLILVPVVAVIYDSLLIVLISLSEYLYVGQRMYLAQTVAGEKIKLNDA